MAKLAVASSTAAETASAAPLTVEDGAQPVPKVSAYLNKRLTYAAGTFLFDYTAIYTTLGLRWQHLATVIIFEAQARFFSTLVSSCAECSMFSLLQSLRLPLLYLNAKCLRLFQSSKLNLTVFFQEVQRPQRIRKLPARLDEAPEVNTVICARLPVISARLPGPVMHDG